MDVDLDFADRNHALLYFGHVTAAIKDAHGTFKRHNTGVYVQNIPHNPITQLSTIDYKEASARGYFKIDFLNVSVYQHIRDEEHLIKLMNTEPLWELLEREEFVNLLFHVSGYSDILKLMKPKTVEQLAAVLAMIRPAKRHLVGKSWKTVLSTVWKKGTKDHGYAFRKSHSISYAMVVIVHMNLICEQLERGIDPLTAN